MQVLQTCLADPAQTVHLSASEMIGEPLRLRAVEVKAEAAALLCSFVDDISSKEVGTNPMHFFLVESQSKGLE